MSQETVDAFRRGTEAINRGDLDIEELIHPEVVFEPLRSRTEGAFVGHEGMRRFIADTEEMFEVFQASTTPRSVTSVSACSRSERSACARK